MKSSASLLLLLLSPLLLTSETEADPAAISIPTINFDLFAPAHIRPSFSKPQAEPKFQMLAPPSPTREPDASPTKDNPIAPPVNEPTAPPVQGRGTTGPAQGPTTTEVPTVSKPATRPTLDQSVATSLPPDVFRNSVPTGTQPTPPPGDTTVQRPGSPQNEPPNALPQNPNAPPAQNLPPFPPPVPQNPNPNAPPVQNPPPPIITSIITLPDDTLVTSFITPPPSPTRTNAFTGTPLPNSNFNPTISNDANRLGFGISTLAVLLGVIVAGLI